MKRLAAFVFAPSSMKRLAALAFALGLLAVPALAGVLENPPQVVKFSQSLTPTATSAAIQTVEQTFTVTGLLTTDRIILTAPAAPTSLCPAVSARVSASNTLAIAFSVLTASACTPAAGTYLITAIR